MDMCTEGRILYSPENWLIHQPFNPDYIQLDLFKSDLTHGGGHTHIPFTIHCHNLEI